MASIAANVRRRVVIGRDFRLIGGTVGMEMCARLLSLAFYVAAGRLMLPAEFGVFRYTAALGGALFLFGNILGRATARELGATDEDRDAFRRTVTASLELALPMSLLAIGAGVALVGSGLTPTADLLGLVAMLIGRTAFEVYYAVARGGRMLGRMAATYVGYSAAQVVILLVVGAFWSVSATEALIVFGASTFIPIVVCELRDPVLVGRLRFPVGDARGKILSTAKPLLLSHAFFLLWVTADQLFVEAALNPDEVGWYGAAKTLAHMFSVLPYALNAALTPRIAQLRTRGDAARARKLLRTTMIGSVAVTAAGAGLIALLGPWIAALLFGEEYRPAGDVLGILGFGYIAYMGVAVISAVAVGWGRKALYTVTTGVAGVSQLILLLTIDYSSGETVALINAATMGAALVVAAVWITVRPLGAGDGR